MRIRSMVRWSGWMWGGLLAGCAGGGGESECAGVMTSVGTVCVIEGPITETGFSCPPEMPFEYQGEFGGERWAMCASSDGLDAAALSEAYEESQGRAPDEATRDPGCLDEDRDGVCDEERPECADGDETCDELTPGCPEGDADNDGYCDSCRDIDADGVTCDGPEVGLCIDEDADLSCQGWDGDDQDPEVRGIGPRVGTDGRTYVVVCHLTEGEWGELESGLRELTPDDCWGIDVCLAVDPDEWQEPAPAVYALARTLCAGWTGGTVVDEDQIDSFTLMCEAQAATTPAAAAPCWYAIVPCLDEAGAVTTCSRGGGEEPCRDDDRDGRCD